MNIVEQNIVKLKELCKTHKVYRLFVFGSVLTEKFDQDSDIDFIVDFESQTPIEYTDNYFDFKFSLEQLFGRKIDLLENQSINNRFFRESVDKSKKLIYGC